MRQAVFTARLRGKFDPDVCDPVTSGGKGLKKPERSIEAGQSHDLRILDGPLVGGRGGERHRLSIDLRGIGDPIRSRHKAGALCDRRFHGQSVALHFI